MIVNKAWLFKYAPWIILFFIVGSFLAYKNLEKEHNMPPPFVYLIPENFFGPVFVLFDQPDGVDLTQDPLGMAVTVPENGLIKLKAKTQASVPSNNNKQNIYWIKINSSGQRETFIVAGPTYRNEQGVLTEYYADKNSKTLAFPVVDGKPAFHYFTESQKNERMIFANGGCKQQRFKPEAEGLKNSPACGKFLVLSPNELLKEPYWIWHDLDIEYDSIADLENDLNEVLKKKKMGMGLFDSSAVQK